MTILSETSGGIVLAETQISQAVTAIILSQTNGALVLSESNSSSQPPVGSNEAIVLSETNGALVLGDTGQTLSSNAVFSLNNTDPSLFTLEYSLLNANSITVVFNEDIQGSLSGTLNSVALTNILQVDSRTYTFDAPNGGALPGSQAQLTFTDATGDIVTDVIVDLPAGWETITRTQPAPFIANGIVSGDIIFWNNTSVNITADSTDYIYEVGITNGETFNIGVLQASSGYLGGGIGTVTVNQVNRTPTVTDVPNFNLEVGDSGNFDLTAYASDPDLGDENLTYTSSDLPANGISVTAAGLLEYNNVTELAETTFIVDVSDGEISVQMPITFTIVAGTLLASGSISLDNITSTGAGNFITVAALNETLENVTLVGTGGISVTGILSETLDDVTSTGIGAIPLNGIINQGLEDVTSNGSGLFLPTGNGQITLDNVTSNATGIIPPVAVGAITLDEQQLIGVASLTISTPNTGSGLSTEIFKIRYPYFATTDNLVIDITISDIVCDISRSKFIEGDCGDNQYERVIYARVAHEIYITQQARVGNVSTGQVTSKTVGKTSVSYSTNMVHNMDEQYFGQTIYGQQYLTLLRQYCGVGLFTAC